MLCFLIICIKRQLQFFLQKSDSRFAMDENNVFRVRVPSLLTEYVTWLDMGVSLIYLDAMSEDLIDPPRGVADKKEIAVQLKGECLQKFLLLQMSNAKIIQLALMRACKAITGSVPALLD